MIEFQLFRIKVFPSAQKFLFETQLTPLDILTKAIESKPEGTLRRGGDWHIGDVEKLDDSGYYFRFGRTTKATLEMFHNGHFEDTEYETTPYTHVFLDVDLEITAIAKKPKLSPTIVGIANQLSRLLNTCDSVIQYKARIEIIPIQDPEDLIVYIRKAFNINRFSMTFSSPNVWDVNKDFIQPAQQVLNQINGEKGRVDFRGQDLKAAPLEEFVRSVASTGNDASVRLKDSEKSKPKTRRLRGRAVTVSEEEVSITKQKQSILDHLRNTYRKIRGSTS